MRHLKLAPSIYTIYYYYYYYYYTSFSRQGGDHRDTLESEVEKTST